MTTLLIAEHDNSNLNESVKKAITAALSIGEKVDLLVAGNDCNSVANEAAKIAGVNKVLLCENDIYSKHIAGLTKESVEKTDFRVISKFLKIINL